MTLKTKIKIFFHIFIIVISQYSCVSENFSSEILQEELDQQQANLDNDNFEEENFINEQDFDEENNQALANQSEEAFQEERQQNFNENEDGEEISEKTEENRKELALLTQEEDTSKKNSDPKTTEENTIKPQASKTEVVSANMFSGRPFIPGTLRDMAVGEAPQEYVIQQGDRLFDICEQLLGEGSYWPKLWSLNPYIKNPHFIWPGMRLRFYSGDSENPPFIELAKEQDVVPISQDPELPIEEFVRENILPTSDTLEGLNVEVIDPKQIQSSPGLVTVAGNLYKGKDIRTHIPGFIYANSPKNLCSVAGGIEGERIVSKGQKFICYIKEEENALTSDRSYTVLRRSEVVQDNKGNKIGFIYRLIARVKPLGINKTKKTVLGIVADSFDSLEKGDIITHYRSSLREFSIGPPFESTGQSEATIIALGNPGQLMGGLGSFAFIDKGLSSNVKPGQVYAIAGQYKYQRLFGEAAYEAIETRAAGYIKIVDATTTGSVGFIIHSNKEIEILDRLKKS